jgi:hypothetical protein
LHLQLRLSYALGDFDGARELLTRIPKAVLREDRVSGIATEVYLARGEPEQALEVLPCRQEPHFGHSIALVIGG